jgi:CRISPR-associated protein Csb2
MGTTVAFRFPLGRYHATPWNRSVNEGATEWPPSPWRLLRALVATWYTRWPDLPAQVLDALLDALGDPPSYLTPATRPGHSRHYLPDLGHKKGETGGTDLTLDPFLAVGRDQELLVRWDADLGGEQRDALAKLVELVPYLGRADSICEARLLAEDPEPDDAWWVPGTEGARQARLLAPARPVSRPALEITTVAVRRGRGTVPPGATWVGYAAGPQATVARAARRPAVTVQAIRFFVAGAVPLKSTHAILLADEVHRLAGAKLADAGVEDARRQVILGSKGAASNHEHAHWVPVADTSDRGASVQALVLWVPAGLRPEEVAPIIGVRCAGGHRGRSGDGEGYEIRGFPPVELLFQAAGPVEQVAPELCGPARRWRSLTPYLPVRHRKRESQDVYLTADLAAELAYRDRPPALMTKAEPGQRLPDRWAQEFRRYRQAERLRNARPGLGLQLEFADDQPGPLLLGQLSHFGYGIFAPEPG